MTLAVKLVACLSLAAAPAADTWTLPSPAPIREVGPRTYRFTQEYTASTATGEVVHRQRVEGDYTRGLPGGAVRWSRVEVAEAAGAGGPLPPAHRRDFMEGFTYRRGVDTTGAPDFFRGFPPTAVVERNLVWDTQAIEFFGQGMLGRLVLNQAIHVIEGQDLHLPEVGTFQNRDVQLTWVGRSRRNRRDCAVIEYSALANPLDVDNGGTTLKGRSHYWGQIWVSLATRQIEHATLSEVVIGELRLPGQERSQVISVLRTGVFELLQAGAP